jgi:hypothetical protein
VIKKEAEEILKYKDFIIEMQCIWIVKAKTVLVIIGATGTLSVSLGQYLSNVPGRHKIKDLQKEPYRHCTQLWKVLTCTEHISRAKQLYM